MSDDLVCGHCGQPVLIEGPDNLTNGITQGAVNARRHERLDLLHRTFNALLDGMAKAGRQDSDPQLVREVEAMRARLGGRTWESW